MSEPLNVGMIGYGFMGRAHSNAFLQVSHFFERRYRPVLKACCGRTKAKLREFATAWGYESMETDWRRLVERAIEGQIEHSSTRELHSRLPVAQTRRA